MTCENPEELLAGFGAGARIRIQSGSASAGPFSDVAFVTLVAATRAYTYEHLAGTSSTWYQTRFEDSTGANANDYLTPFQVGDEQAGYLCSLYDVKQRLGIAPTDLTSDEDIAEFIGQVSAEIAGYTGRWFARVPSSGTTTFLFDVDVREGWYFRSFWLAGRTLRIPVGIAQATTLELATTSQPDSGGSYSSIATSDWFIHPPTAQRDFGWPATKLILSDRPTGGGLAQFYPGYNTVRLTGALGWATVPRDIQGVAQAAVVRRFMAKGSNAADLAVVGPSGQLVVLAGLSPADQRTLDRYKVNNVR
jgi:hypothetical protein